MRSEHLLLAFVAIFLLLLTIGDIFPVLGIGSLLGLIAVYLGGALGANTFLMYGFFNTIPDDLDEAAKIDGANSWHGFWNITIPMLSPTIFFNLIMGIIGTFQVFAAPYIMTNGGPERATTFYVLYLYNLAFGELRMGYASAMAWVLFVLILLLTLLATKVSKRHVHYER